MNKYTQFAFSIGHIKVKVPVTKDKYELKLPDPFSWKIYDNSNKALKKETIFFTNLPFDFQSLIDMLPYKKTTLEETIADDNIYNLDNYRLTNHPMKLNKLEYDMEKEGSNLRCHTFMSNERKHLINPQYEDVTYVIFISGTEGNLKIKHMKYMYKINLIYNIRPLKKDILVVKNIHYYGVWLQYIIFN
jgi:hypothetical protein